MAASARWSSLNGNCSTITTGAILRRPIRNSNGSKRERPLVEEVMAMTMLSLTMLWSLAMSVVLRSNMRLVVALASVFWLVSMMRPAVADDGDAWADLRTALFAEKPIKDASSFLRLEAPK